MGQSTIFCGSVFKTTANVGLGAIQKYAPSPTSQWDDYRPLRADTSACRAVTCRDNSLIAETIAGIINV